MEVAGTEERIRLPREIREGPEEQLFVFRTLEISNVMPRGAAKSLPIEAEHFLQFAGSWHDHCKSNVCKRTAFNKMNQNPCLELRAPFANAPRNFQVL